MCGDCEWIEDIVIAQIFTLGIKNAFPFLITYGSYPRASIKIKIFAKKKNIFAV